MTYLATTRTGRRYFVGLLADNPRGPVASRLPLLSAIRIAFALAAASGFGGSPPAQFVTTAGNRGV